MYSHQVDSFNCGANTQPMIPVLLGAHRVHTPSCQVLYMLGGNELPTGCGMWIEYMILGGVHPIYTCTLLPCRLDLSVTLFVLQKSPMHLSPEHWLRGCFSPVIPSPIQLNYQLLPALTTLPSCPQTAPCPVLSASLPSLL